MATIPLSTLLDFLVQRSYHDLTSLTELLPRKSEVDKKIEIVQYAKRVRMMFVRLLALVKWASTAESLKRCTVVSEEVDQQTRLFIDSADRLYNLSKETLTKASLPNFGLANAIDVLTSGNYPRLPTCIQTALVPHSSLQQGENRHVMSILEDVIRKRLIVQPLPSSLEHHIKIDKGRVVISVTHEFQTTLTLLGDDPMLPWRLLDFEIFTDHPSSGQGPLVHSVQKVHLHRLLQSRLFTTVAPLVDMYNTLHTFCLSLQLDILHCEALKLSQQVCSSHLVVEEYKPGEHLRLAYWRATGTVQTLHSYLQQSSGYASPKLSISLQLNGENSSHFVLEHIPDIPLDRHALDEVHSSIHTLLNKCIRANTRHQIEDLHNVLKGTVFESKVTVEEEPHALKVNLGHRDQVCLISIDPRLGRVILTVEPNFTEKSHMKSKLTEMEQHVTSNHHTLTENLKNLRLLLYQVFICCTADEMGYTYTLNAPLVTPPADLPPHSVFIHHKFSDGIYVVVSPSIMSDGWSLESRFFQMWTTPASTFPLGSTQSLPVLFQVVKNCIELNILDLMKMRNGCVPVATKGVMLKRKLQQHSIEIPSSKRLCPQSIDLRGMLQVSIQEICIYHAVHQLKTYNICCTVKKGVDGNKVIRILKFPHLKECSLTVQNVMSENLISCHFLPVETGWVCTLSQRQTVFPLSDGERVIHSSEIDCQVNVGKYLMDKWRSMCTLLYPVLQLSAMVNDSCTFCNDECRVVSFDYATIEFQLISSNIRLTLQAEINEIAIKMDETCTHYIFKNHLEAFLNKSGDIALMIQGLLYTFPAACLIHKLQVQHSKLQQQFFTVDSKKLAQVTFSVFGVYNLEFWLHNNGSVVIQDGGPKQMDSSQPSLMNPGIHIKSFLRHFLAEEGEDGGVLDSNEIGIEIGKSDEFSKPATVLAPSPSPVPTPKIQPTPSPLPTTTWGMGVSPASPSIPNLPSVPSPRTPRIPTNTSDAPVGWSFLLRPSKFEQLFTLDSSNECPLTHCLGCLSLMHQFLQADKQAQWRQRSRDHGSSTAITDTLQVTISLVPPHYNSLKLHIEPLKEFSLSSQEMDTIIKFFNAQVVSPPYNRNNLIAFVRLLSFPIQVLRNCIQIMQTQMFPPPDVHWHIKLCLTIPEGLITEVTQPGATAVAYKGRVGKLLLFVLLQSVTMMGCEVVVPLLHEPLTNVTSIIHLPVARPQAQREAILKAIEHVLRTTLQDFQQGGSQCQECSLFPGVKAIIENNLYDTMYT